MSGNIQKKVISFRDEYLPEYEFLQSCGNASRLVCELVRQYRLNKGSNLEFNKPAIVTREDPKTQNKYGLDILHTVRELLD